MVSVCLLARTMASAVAPGVVAAALAGPASVALVLVVRIMASALASAAPGVVVAALAGPASVALVLVVRDLELARKRT